MSPSEPGIQSVVVRDTGEKLEVRILVENPLERAVHMYESFETFRYDPVTKTLELNLYRRPRDSADPAPTLARIPRLVAIDPESTFEIAFEVPRVFTTFGPSDDPRRPRFVTIPVHEATRVVVEIAGSDTPFYRDPRLPDRKGAGPVSTEELGRELIKWAQWNLRAECEGPSSEDPKDPTEPAGD